MMTFESWKGTTMVVPPNEKRIPLTDGAKRNSARHRKSLANRAGLLRVT